MNRAVKTHNPGNIALPTQRVSHSSVKQLFTEGDRHYEDPAPWYYIDTGLFHARVCPTEKDPQLYDYVIKLHAQNTQATCPTPLSKGKAMAAVCMHVRRKLRWSHAQLCDYVLNGKRDSLASTLASLLRTQKAAKMGRSSHWAQAFSLSTPKFLAEVTFCPDSLYYPYQFAIIWQSGGQPVDEGAFFTRPETAAEAVVEYARRKLRWTRKQMDDHIVSEIVLTSLASISSVQDGAR